MSMHQGSIDWIHRLHVKYFPNSFSIIPFIQISFKAKKNIFFNPKLWSVVFNSFYPEKFD